MTQPNSRNHSFPLLVCFAREQGRTLLRATAKFKKAKQIPSINYYPSAYGTSPIRAIARQRRTLRGCQLRSFLNSHTINSQPSTIDVFSLKIHRSASSLKIPFPNKHKKSGEPRLAAFNISTTGINRLLLPCEQSNQALC